MTQVIDFIGGEYRNRTGVHGFAIRCVTTPPTRRSEPGFSAGWMWVQGAMFRRATLLRWLPPAAFCGKTVHE